MKGDATNKRKLILLVNGFPYGHREPYIETELPYLVNEFDEVVLCALNVRTQPEPEIPECELDVVRKLNYKNVSVLPVEFASKATYVMNGICCLWDKCFWSELSRLRRGERLTKQTCFSLMKFISRARYEARRIYKQIVNSSFIDDADDVIVYSYRFDYQPYIGLLLKEKWPSIKIVARAHRRDLYEDRVRANYIPLREVLLKRLDAIYCISEHGRRYLQEKFSGLSDKVYVRRLGTEDHGWVFSLKKGNEPLRIASCSFLVPVKRVHLIVEALMGITNFEVEWTHFGGGPEEACLRDMCRALPPNVKADFRGTVSNDVILQEYMTHPFHLFINVSESEGVPVSIMEALSTGIPVIATDVGGTGEIVHEGVNGWLLPCNLRVRSLTDLLVLVSEMDDSSYFELRSKTRRRWERECCSEIIYKKYAADLVRIIGR